MITCKKCMMEALQSYSGEESALEDSSPKKEDEKSDQEVEDKQASF